MTVIIIVTLLTGFWCGHLATINDPSYSIVGDVTVATALLLAILAAYGFYRLVW